MTDPRNNPPGNRVLILGRLQSILDPILRELRERGLAAEGTTAADRAPERYDANDFDLISIGGGIFGEPAERLKAVFRLQNPDIRFLDAFGPVAVRQILAELGGPRPSDPHLADVRVEEDGPTDPDGPYPPDALVRATVRRPATVTVEVYRAIDAPPPPIDLIASGPVAPGPFVARIPGDLRAHAFMLLVTVTEDPDEFFVHRLRG